MLHFVLQFTLWCFQIYSLSCHCQACVQADLTDLTFGLMDDEHFDMHICMLACVYTFVYSNMQ